MATSDWITIIGLVVGLFITTMGSTLLLVFKMGIIHNKIDTMQETLKEIPMIKLTIAQMLVKLEVLWQAHLSISNSPISLNEVGLKALETSNIGAFVERVYSEILARVKASNPQNAYQAQEALISILSSYQNNEEYRLKLQEAAYASGHDVDSLLFVGALAIRDRVILDLGF